MPLTRAAVRAGVARLATVLAGASAALAAVPTVAVAQAAPADPAAQATQAAQAPGAIRWTVQPAGPEGPDGRDWFEYDVAPGDDLVDYVSITNLGTTTVDFSVYATDAYTTADGGFALLPREQPATDAGSWISLEAGDYRVPAGHRIDIPFRLTVPANATPGDHAGGIVAAVTSRQSRADGQQLDLEQRVGARIYLRVAGPVAPAVAVESMTVTRTNPFLPWQPSRTTVTYVLRNTGNLRVSGQAGVTVDGPFGWRLADSGSAELPELLPGSTLTVTEQIYGVLPAVWLRGTVRVQPATGEQPLPAVVRERTFWAVPWFLLTVLALAGALLVASRIRRRSRRPPTEAATPARPVSRPRVPAGGSVAGHRRR